MPDPVQPGERILRLVARRLRAAREDQGHSLSALARAADVSRRYLTEAEAGRANPSLLVLARLGAALGVPLADLVADEDGPRGRSGERIALVGLRGAGKSTVGRGLARELDARFVELDARIEELAGMSLAEIFDLHGQDTFHRWEAEALESVLAEGERVVLATGGSLVLDPANFARLRETCRTIWLRADPEDHFQRVVEQGDRRPMRHRPRAMDELRSLLAAREPLYRRCDGTIDTSAKDVDGVVAEILARWGP